MRLRLIVLPLLFGACAPSSGYVTATYAPDVYLPPAPVVQEVYVQPPPVVHERVYVAPRYDYWVPPHHGHVPYHPPRVQQAPPAYRAPASPSHVYGAHQAPPASGSSRGHRHPH